MVVAALLLLICTCTTRGQAARPEPGSEGHTPQQLRADVSISVVAGHEKKSGSSVAVVEMRREDPDQAARECEDDDGDDEQECLMRRTLLAHTDYIYTQGKHN
nr:TPA_exp: putative phytosulfokine peptide precursor [Zea mays]